MPLPRALALIALLGLCTPDVLAAPATKKRAVKTEGKSSKKAPGKKRRLPSLAVSAMPRRPAALEGRELAERTTAKGAKGRARKKQVREPKPDRFPPIKLESINTKEKLTLHLYDRRGRVLKPSVRKVWHLMRCHLTKLERPISWRLIRQLYRISRRYPGKTIQIFSGLRAKRVSALPNSNHIKGRAVDFHVAGVSNNALRDFLLQSCRPCGVGYYPNGLFVHLDVRERQSAFWVDYSAKGERSEYASNPYQVLRGEKGSKTRKESGSASLAKKTPPASRPATEAPDPEPPPESEAKPEVAKPEEKPGGDSAGRDRNAAPPKLRRGEDPAPETSGGAPTAGIPRGRTAAPAL